MKTETETITEATATVAAMRVLDEKIAAKKDEIKELKDSRDGLDDHLCHLFEADENDANRPLLDDQAEPSEAEPFIRLDRSDIEAMVPRHTVTAEAGGKARRRK